MSQKWRIFAFVIIVISLLVLVFIGGIKNKSILQEISSVIASPLQVSMLPVSHKYNLVVSEENKVSEDESFSVESSKFKEDFSINIDSNELRSFVGTDLINVDLESAEHMIMGLGFSDSMKLKSESHVLVFLKVNMDEYQYLKDFEVIIENISKEEVVVRLPLMPVAGISIQSDYTNNGYLDARAYLKNHIVSNDRLAIFIPLKPKHFRKWVFPVQDILLKREDLVGGVNENLIVVMTMSGFVQRDGKREYFPINYHFETKSVGFKLPTSYSEFSPFNYEEFAGSAFSDFISAYTSAKGI